MHGGIVIVRIAGVASIVIVITVVTSLPVRADSAPAPPRLRLPDRRLLPVVEAGRDRSASFRALIDRLETTDVVVYVQCANPDIVSAGTMALAYERFGFTRNRGLDRVDFDTVAAIETGATIGRELADRANGD